MNQKETQGTVKENILAQANLAMSLFCSLQGVTSVNNIHVQKIFIN